MVGIITALGLTFSAAMIATDWWLTILLRQTGRSPRESRIYVLALLLITIGYLATLGITVYNSPDRAPALVAFEPGLAALVVAPSIASRLWRINHRH